MLQCRVSYKKPKQMLRFFIKGTEYYLLSAADGPGYL